MCGREDVLSETASISNRAAPAICSSANSFLASRVLSYIYREKKDVVRSKAVRSRDENEMHVLLTKMPGGV